MISVLSDVFCIQCKTEASSMVSLHLNRLQNTLPLVHDSNMYFHKKAAVLKARFLFFSFLCHELRIWNGADLNNDIFWKTAAPEYSLANTLARHTQDAGIINVYLYNQALLNTCIWLFVQTYENVKDWHCSPLRTFTYFWRVVSFISGRCSPLERCSLTFRTHLIRVSPTDGLDMVRKRKRSFAGLQPEAPLILHNPLFHFSSPNY
jgi:hypothetical protein